MNERIKKIRKALDLTQQEFAERIGMKRNSIALIESGRNTSDQTIFAICREFNVNEEWLKTGKGEMFKPAPSSALDALAKEYSLSTAAYVMVEKFISLKPEAQETIFHFVQDVAAAFQSDEVEPEAPAPAAAEREKTVDELEAEYKKSVLRSAPKTESSAMSTTDATAGEKAVNEN